MFAYIVKLLKAINANSKPAEIANAVCVGLILGFVPKTNVLWYILAVFFLFVRMNKSAYVLMILLGSLIAPTFDLYFDKVGYTVLTFQPFESFFSTLIDVPFVIFTKINNTVVCGSFVIGLLAYIPLFIIVILFIKLWRSKLSPAINSSPLIKAFYKIPLVDKLSKKIAQVI